MRVGAILSAGVHVVVILLMWLGVPSMFSRQVELERAVSVEVVTLEQKPMPKPKKEKPPEEPQRAEQPPPPPPEPPALPKLAPPEPAPPAVAKAEPEAVPLPEPKPEPEPVPQKAPEAPKDEPKIKVEVKPKPAPPPPPKNRMASILKTIETLKDEPDEEDAPKAEESRQRSSLDEAQVQQTLADAVRRQIEPCWNIPAGAKDAENLVVEVRVNVNPDGQVRDAAIVDMARARSDPFFRTAAESALRAVLNPRCRTLKLPLDAYDVWKTMTLTFDPKELV